MGTVFAWECWMKRRVCRTESREMALPFDVPADTRSARGLAILAKTLYREMRAEGYGANQVMTLASELLGLVASEVRDRRDSEPADTSTRAPS